MKVTARVRRSGGWWAIDVPEVAGVFTQAKRLDQVAEQVADAVATMRGIDPATVEVSLDAASVLEAGLETQVQRARSLAKAAEAAQQEATAAMRAAVSGLREQAKLSIRDVGVLLGVSHQRVGQISEAGQGAAKSASKRPAKESTKTPAKARGAVTALPTKASGKYLSKGVAASRPAAKVAANKAAAVEAPSKTGSKPSAKKPTGSSTRKAR